MGNDINTQEQKAALNLASSNRPAVTQEGSDRKANASERKNLADLSGKQTEEKDNNQEVSHEAMVKVADRMNEFSQSVSRDLEFQVDNDVDKVVITVTDSETKEVIRQIPSEEALKLARSMQDGKGGILETEA